MERCIARISRLVRALLPRTSWLPRNPKSLKDIFTREWLGELRTIPDTTEVKPRWIHCWSVESLVGFHHSRSSNAGSADARSSMSAINNNPDPLEIGIPSSLGNVVRMADIVSKERTLPTDITTRSHSKPPIKANSKTQIIAEALPGVKLLWQIGREKACNAC